MAAKCLYTIIAFLLLHCSNSKAQEGEYVRETYVFQTTKVRMCARFFRLLDHALFDKIPTPNETKKYLKLINDEKNSDIVLFVNCRQKDDNIYNLEVNLTNYFFQPSSSSEYAYFKYCGYNCLVSGADRLNVYTKGGQKRLVIHDGHMCLNGVPEMHSGEGLAVGELIYDIIKDTLMVKRISIEEPLCRLMYNRFLQKDSNKKKVFDYNDVDEKPKGVKDDIYMKQYVENEYHKVFRDSHILVPVEFVINEDGRVADKCRVFINDSRLYENQVVKLKDIITSMPSWSPGCIRNKFVRTRIRVNLYL